MEISVPNAPLEVTISVPFPTNRHARIAYDVLRIDPEPTRSLVTKNIKLDEHHLIVNFTGSVSKNVRVALTAFYENLILCCETMESFGVSTEDYKFY